MLVTPDTFGSAMDALDRVPRLITDTETTGVRTWQADKVVGVAARTPDLGSPAYYFPVRHKPGGNLPKAQYKKLLKRLGRPGTTLTGWNTKFDIEMLMKDGMPFPDEAEDVMLAAHLMNENEPNFRLKDTACRYIDPSAADAEKRLIALLRDKGLGKGDMAELYPSEVEEYGTGDVDLTEKMRNIYEPALVDWSLRTLWDEVNRYMLVTTKTERRGLLLDIDRIHKYRAEATRMIDPTVAALQKIADYPCNPRSHPQMQGLMNLPSTAKEVLEPLIEMQHPMADAMQLLLDFRGWDRVNTAYYDAYLAKHDSNGVLHPNIKLHGTVAGRPSSEDPNLQAVPRYTKVYKVKDVFVSRPGYVFISADYNQAELRMGTHYTRDEAMAAILMAGGDIHQAVADQLDIPRDTAKRINFGAFYRIGAKKLAKTLRIPIKDAERWLKTYHGQFTGIRPLTYYMEDLARLHGYIRMWTGRCRRYNTSRSEPHKALSNLVQGGVGELMRTAILNLDTEMADHGKLDDVHMLLQVHDQILFEVPQVGWKRRARTIKEIMEDFTNFRVPPKVDLKVGTRWGEVHEWAA